jgi:hypothetical protein
VAETGAGPGGAERREASAALVPMNDEINQLVARRGESTVEDLVPEVESIMRRYGVNGMSREGVMQWIDEAMASARENSARENRAG